MDFWIFDFSKTMKVDKSLILPLVKSQNQINPVNDRYLPHEDLGIDDYFIKISQTAISRQETLGVLGNLAKCQIIVSLIFFFYGIVGFGYLKNHDLHNRLCAASTISGSTGICTGLIGVLAVFKFRWKCLMVTYLTFSILCSVSYLILLINISVWLNLPNLADLGNPVYGGILD